MKVDIIAIGDELLIGQTVNTNAAFLGKEFTKIGIEVRQVLTIGDNAEQLVTTLTDSLKNSDLVLTTGGLGPTHDDLTKRILTDYFGGKLDLDGAILQRLKKAFAAHGSKMSKINEEQALVPDNAKLINNPVGTAQGLIFESDGKHCVVLPGVPSEMKAMWQETILPMFRDRSEVILQKTIRTTGVPESTLFEKVQELTAGEEVSVAFLPKGTGVDIRLTARGTNADQCESSLATSVRLFEDKIAKFIYAFDEESLEEIVARLLSSQKKTIATAESCTGGLLANKLTNVSGSSAYFERGLVTYSNEAKMELLDVPEETLQAHGAVSAETAKAMAAGVRKLAQSDFGISTTGIAGPSGSTEEKPVGLVYIGFASETEIFSKRLLFTKDRIGNKERTVQAALNLIRKQLSDS